MVVESSISHDVDILDKKVDRSVEFDEKRSWEIIFIESVEPLACAIEMFYSVGDIVSTVLNIDGFILSNSSDVELLHHQEDSTTTS